MYETLVVPTDGSDLSGRALDRAVALAETYGATVHVVHVVTSTALSTAEGGAVLQLLETDGRDLVTAAADRVRAAGATVETATLTGAPHRAIVDHADRLGADLIVMGTHGRTGLAHVALGSVAERVVRSAPVPVLTVGPSAPTDGEVDGVLVPTDGSAAAATALPHAFELATRYGATVHALSVVDDAVYGIEASMTGFVDDLSTASEEAVEVVASRAPADCSLVTAVERGTPHAEIDAYVAAHDVDLVAMGTHGRSGLERLVLGSVTARVVRSAPVPVLAVPPDAR
ncbi:MAG: universal stress protein [Haloarculaceae archaeon]